MNRAGELWYLRGGLFVALALIAAVLLGNLAVDTAYYTKIEERERARSALDTVLVTSAEQLAYLGGIRDAIGPILAVDDRNGLERTIPRIESAVARLKEAVAAGHVAPRSIAIFTNRLIAPFKTLDRVILLGRKIAEDDESWGEASTFDVANSRAAIMQTLPLIRQIKGFEQTELDRLAAQLTWWRGAGIIVGLATLTVIGGGIFLPLERRIRSDRVMLQAERRAAEDASAVKSTFIATMSHEIRTPLVGILGSAELLRDTPAGSEAEELRAIILASGRSLLTVLNDVLDISTLEAGKVQIRTASTDIRQVVTEIGQLFAAQATAKGIGLNIRISETVAPLHLTDAARLRQVLSNLVGNAVKFTDTGKVDLALSAPSTGPDRQALIFEVSDTGIGIDPDELKLVFEAFSQAGSGGRHQAGTGLGLAISMGLARAMNSRLTARSEPGKGSAFCLHIELPICDTGAADVATAISVSTDPTPRAMPRRSAAEALKETGQVVKLRPRPGHRVLVVDDNMTNRIIATKMLDHVNWVVDLACDGHQAIAQFTQHKPDLILMDISMPGMDGYEATAAIRRIEAEQGLARTHIVALSAHVNRSHIQRCLATGMDDVLQKPISRANIESTLSRIDSNQAVPVAAT